MHPGWVLAELFCFSGSILQAAISLDINNWALVKQMGAINWNISTPGIYREMIEMTKTTITYMYACHMYLIAILTVRAWAVIISTQWHWVWPVQQLRKYILAICAICAYTYIHTYTYAYTQYTCNDSDKLLTLGLYCMHDCNIVVVC